MLELFRSTLTIPQLEFPSRKPQIVRSSGPLMLTCSMRRASTDHVNSTSASAISVASFIQHSISRCRDT